MFTQARASLIAHMALALSSIALGTPGSVKNLLLAARVLPHENDWPQSKPTNGNASRTRKRRPAKKLHHRQKR